MLPAEVRQLLDHSYELTTKALRDGHLKVSNTIPKETEEEAGP